MSEIPDSVVVLVEIDDTDYRVEHVIDPHDQIVKTLHRLAAEQDIPLRTKSGRPYPWTVEGPDVRPGREGGWTDLTRTQTLEKVTEWYLGEYGERKPLFDIKFFIPGAVEAIREKRAAEKAADIEARMAARAAEREEEARKEREARVADLGEAEDLTMEDSAPEPPPPPPPPPPLPEVSEDLIATEAVQRIQPEEPAGAESRIRRRASNLAAGAAVAGMAVAAAPKPARGGTGEVSTIKERKPPPAAKKAPAKKAAPKKAPPKKAPAKGKKGKASGQPPWVWAAAGGGVLLVLGLVFALMGGDPEPEPTPTPAPTPVPEITPQDIVISKKETPTPAPVEATPTPVPMEIFFSKATIESWSAKQDAARLTSFAKTQIRIAYKAEHTAPGQTHQIELEGRFLVKISDSGTTVSGGASGSVGGVAVGTATAVDLRFDGSRLTLKVGGSRKVFNVGGSSDFPRWRIIVPDGAKITGFNAWGPPDS